MPDFKQGKMTLGQRVLYFLRNPIFRAVFLVFCILVAGGVVRSVITVWEKRGIVHERQAVLDAEEAKHAELNAQLREATSAAFIERQARNKLGLIKEGESVIIMDQLPSSASGTQSDQSQSPWQQWWGLFF